MKKFNLFLSVLLCASLLLSAVCHGEYAAQDGGKLNISPITEVQAELCTAVMIDGFEGEETKRTADDGTLIASSDGALEGGQCLKMVGNDKVGVTLVPNKKRNTSNTRSLCVCLYAEPSGDAEFYATVTMRGSKKSFTATAYLPSGQWCAAYLPVDTSSSVKIDDINVTVSAKSDASVRVVCRVDRVHTALVDGLPDKLPYFASDFTATRGKITYTANSLIFTPDGSNSSFESTDCGYMTNGVYNALAVTLVNNCTAEKIKMSFKLDKQRSYNDENSKTLALKPGENVYYFNIGGFQSGTTVASFKIELPGSAKGNIEIKSIGFATYRFPASYAGTVTAYKSDGRIKISGTMPEYPASSQRICLYRIAPGVDEELPAAIDSEPYATASVSASFSFELPEKDGDLNNAYFKYLVRYEGKNGGYADAGAAYVKTPATPLVTLKYKGVDLPSDLSDVHELLPGAVYIDVSTSSLFVEKSESEFKISDATYYLSDDILSELDRVAELCSKEGAQTVLRITYTAFSGSDKYMFNSENEILPDITTAEGADFYLSLLSYFAGRYSGRVCAVIPCGPLDAQAIASMRGFTADRAEKYASSLIITACNLLAEYGITVMAPVSSFSSTAFVEMLSLDLTDRAYTPVYVEADGVSDLSSYQAFDQYGFKTVVRCSAGSAEELIRLFYGCQDGAAICASLENADENTLSLFSVLDTTYGLEAADALGKDAFPGGVAAYFPNIKTQTKLYKSLGKLEPSELPFVVTTIFDGTDVDGWSAAGSCKNVYTDSVNGESLAAAAFDQSELDYGYAQYEFSEKKYCETLYVRLYADYLPEGTDSVDIKLTVYGVNGTTVAFITLESGVAATAALALDETIGAIDKMTVSPQGLPRDATPRICTLGIYTAEKNSTETVTEATADTMPEPESQRFDTAVPTTSYETKAENGGGTARLYLISICVIITMFALCGAVILILKKKKGAEK